MAGMGAFIGFIVWLDYRSLGRQRIKDADAERFAASALAQWKASGETVAGAQRTERASRVDRVKFKFRQNLKLIIYCDAGIVILFTLLVAVGVIRGTRVDAQYLLGFFEAMLLLTGMFTLLILGVTGIVAFDFIGWRTLKTYAGIYDTTPCEIAVARDGILFRPGGLQRFNYPVRQVEVLKGDISVLVVRTVGVPTPKGTRAQDLYAPIPPGLETEAQILAERMMNGK